MLLALLFFSFLAVTLYFCLRYLWELITVSDMKNKAVFITGCDSGFGRFFAIKCAKSGILTFAGCLTEEGTKNLEDETQHLPGKLYAILLDVTKDESVQDAYNFIITHIKFGQKLWAIINNAGTATSYGPVEWTSIEQYRQAFDINTLGQIRVIKTFLPLIKESRGRICSTTSVLGRITAPYNCSYNVSKHGTEAFMDTLRLELKPRGIKCSIVEPGSFKTPLAIRPRFWIDLIEKTWNNLSKDQKEEYGEEFKDDLISMRTTGVQTYPENFDYVVDNYFHAITARYPRSRYQCGWDAIFYFIPLSLVFPTELQDWIHTRMRDKIDENFARCVSNVEKRLIFYEMFVFLLVLFSCKSTNVNLRQFT